MAEYFRRGTSHAWWTTTLSSTTAPSRAEFTNEGVNAENLHAVISDISGWEFTNSPISTPKLSTTFTTTIIGEDTAGNPEITVYDQNDSTALRDAAAKGTTGWVVLCRLGDAQSNPADVWPVEVIGLTDNWSVGNEAATFTIQFSVTSVPSFQSTIAA